MSDACLELKTVQDVLNIPENCAAIDAIIYDLFDCSDLLSKHLPKTITHIYIRKGSFFSFDPTPICDLKYLESLPNIRCLYLTQYDDSSAVVYTNICQVKLPVSLEEIESDHTIYKNFKFLKHLKNLKKLNLRGVAMQRIQRRDLPASLEVLKLRPPAFGWYFFPKDFICRMKKTNILKRCQNLKKLDLPFDNIDRISDFYFPPNLEILYLRGKGENVRLDFSNHKKLRYLSLYTVEIINELKIADTLEEISIDSCVLHKQILDEFPKNVKVDLCANKLL